jgi:hypothetical protein
VARQTISACLIVQDEQERLPAALDSVAFCDEVVVVDGGSRDRTVALAREAGAKVIENRWPGFAAQRNVAIDAASGDWVLEVDADERVTPELRASIEEFLEAPPPQARMAVFALRNRFLGGLLGPSAKYPAYRSRLFRRGSYRHDEARAVHEGLEPLERPQVLSGDLEHELAGSLREALLDTWAYARLESAHVRTPSNPLLYLRGILLRPAAKLVYRSLVDGGWRDGWRGMLKISLDVASDGLVWLRVLAGARTPADRAPAEQGEHFGHRRAGPVKVVAVADGDRSVRLAVERLLELERRGADVALIATAPAAGCELPVQSIGRLGPLALIRALEAEMHVRRIDAVVPVGQRARLVLGVLPAGFRPPLHEVEDEIALRSS